MIIMMLAAFALIFLVFAFAIILLVKMKNRPQGTWSQEVFAISENKLIVQSGIPVTYNISDIEKVAFSKMRGRYGSYTGIMRIVKNNGRKSLPFMFYGKSTNKFLLANSNEEIDKRTRELVEELRIHHIYSVVKH